MRRPRFPRSRSPCRCMPSRPEFAEFDGEFAHGQFAVLVPGRRCPGRCGPSPCARTVSRIWRSSSSSRAVDTDEHVGVKGLGIVSSSHWLHSRSPVGGSGVLSSSRMCVRRPGRAAAGSCGVSDRRPNRAMTPHGSAAASVRCGSATSGTPSTRTVAMPGRSPSAKHSSPSRAVDPVIGPRTRGRRACPRRSRRCCSPCARAVWPVAAATAATGSTPHTEAR